MSVQKKKQTQSLTSDNQQQNQADSEDMRNPSDANFQPCVGHHEGGSDSSGDASQQQQEQPMQIDTSTNNQQQELPMQIDTSTNNAQYFSHFSQKDHSQNYDTQLSYDLTYDRQPQIDKATQDFLNQILLQEEYDAIKNRLNETSRKKDNQMIKKQDLEKLKAKNNRLKFKSENNIEQLNSIRSRDEVTHIIKRLKNQSIDRFAKTISKSIKINKPTLEKFITRCQVETAHRYVKWYNLRRQQTGPYTLEEISFITQFLQIKKDIWKILSSYYANLTFVDMNISNINNSYEQLVLLHRQLVNLPELIQARETQIEQCTIPNKEFYVQSLINSNKIKEKIVKRMTQQRDPYICAMCGMLLQLQGLHKEKSYIDIKDLGYPTIAQRIFPEFADNIIQNKKNKNKYEVCYICKKHPFDYSEKLRSQPLPQELQKIKSRQQLYCLMLGNIHSYIENKRGQAYYHLLGDSTFTIYNGDMGTYFRELSRLDQWWTHLTKSERSTMTEALEYLKRNNPLFKVFYCNYELLQNLKVNPKLTQILQSFKDKIHMYPYYGKPIQEMIKANDLKHKYGKVNRGFLIERDSEYYIFPVDVEYDDATLSKIIDERDMQALNSFQVINKKEIEDYLTKILKLDESNEDTVIREEQFRQKQTFQYDYLEEMIFPILFPNGSGGYYNFFKKNRTEKQYVKMQLLSCRKEYRLNVDFLMWWYDKVKKTQMLSFNRGVKVTKISDYDGPLTKGQILNMQENKDIYSLFGKKFSRKHVDTPKYYQNKWYELQELINHFKTNHNIPHPHLFVTFTLNENDEYLNLLKDHKHSRFDPVKTVCHFNVKVRHLLRAIYGTDTKSGIFGKTIGHFERVEFTNKGAPHVHVLIWLDEESAKHLDEGYLIQATLPEDANMKNLVQNLQTHNCVPQRCFKNNAQICRYGYPFKQQKHDQILNNKWLYKRNGQDDAWISPYNLQLLQIANASTTVMRMTDTDMSQYLVKYIAKTLPVLDVMLKYPNLTNEESSLVQYLKSRMISSSQAAWQLLGFSLCETKPNVDFVNVQLEENRQRLMKTKDQLKDLEDQSTDINQNGPVDRYYQRPLWMQQVTFKQFMSGYSYSKNYKSMPVDHQQNKERYYYQLNQLYYWKKTTSIITQMRKWYPQAGESYYYYILMQRVPHYRHNIFSQDNKSKTFMEECFLRECLIDQLSLDDSITFWKNTIVDKKLMYQALQRVLSKYELGSIQHDQALRHIEAIDDVLLEEQQESNELIQIIKENYENFQKLIVRESKDYMIENEIGFNPLRRPQFIIEAIDDIKSKLSTQQKEVLLYIHNQIQNKKQICIFITGSPGTGKSYLIKLIRTMIEYCYNMNLEVTATTGTVAAELEGQTIHSLLRINQNNRSTSVPPNSEYQTQIANIDAIIIDEVSMMSEWLLTQVDSVLKQSTNLLYDRNKPFGGKHIILVGDFSQLPPVTKGSTLSQGNESSIIQNELFKHFKWFILQQNFRQGDEQLFQKVLEKIRFSIVDNQVLELISQRQCEQGHSENECNTLNGQNLIITGTNKEKNNYNDEIIDALFRKEQLIEILSIDTTKKGDFIKQLDRKQDDLFYRNINMQQPKLKDQILICTGMTAMITQNIDIAKGLTNGQIVEIIDIPPSKNYLRVKLLKNNQEHFINKSTENYNLTGCIVQRKQFALVPCYAATVHKIQGQTLDKVIVDCNTLYQEGHFYTAISRVRKMTDLHIVNFKPKCIVQNQFISTIYHNKIMQQQQQTQMINEEEVKDIIKFLTSVLSRYPETLINKILQERTQTSIITQEAYIQKQIPEAQLAFEQLYNQRKYKVDTSSSSESQESSNSQNFIQQFKSHQVIPNITEQNNQDYPWIHWYLSSCLQDSFTTIYYFTMFTKDQDVQQANNMEALQLNYSCQLLHNIDKTEVYANAQEGERQQQAKQPLRYNMGDDEAGIDHMEKNLQGSDLFDLVFTTESICNNCGRRVSTDVMNEPIYTLNFDVYQDNNIEGKLLQDLQDNLVGCDTCNTSNCVQVGKNISNMPKYFSILLGDKNTLMNDEIAGEFDLKNQHYQIIGILCYKPSNEHYVCYTLNGQHNDGTIMPGWWFFDGLDHKIINTNISDIKDLQRRMRTQGQYAHLIVYQKS